MSRPVDRDALLLEYLDKAPEGILKAWRTDSLFHSILCRCAHAGLKREQMLWALAEALLAAKNEAQKAAMNAVMNASIFIPKP